MRFKYWIFSWSLIVVAVLILDVKGQEKLEISAEKNEIPYDDKAKISKSSSRPVLTFKEPQYESKTSLEEIKKQVSKVENATPKEREKIVQLSKAENTTPKEREKIAQLSKAENTTPKEREKIVQLSKAENTTPKEREKIVHQKPLPPFICPHKDAAKPLFSFPCFANQNCGFLGKDMLCCEGRCLKGIKPPKADLRHEPIFFGIIERKCPADPLTELSEIKQCFTDDECSPRICCGETLPTGEKIRFCRTPIPVWDSLPLPSPVLEPLKTITSYMQCTPPPPPHLDLYPKSCQNPMDCFPNLCCQEKGKKFCRPPKRSLLALVAELGQKIIPEDAARKFIERIS